MGATVVVGGGFNGGGGGGATGITQMDCLGEGEGAGTGGIGHGIWMICGIQVCGTCPE